MENELPILNKLNQRFAKLGYEFWNEFEVKTSIRDEGYECPSYMFSVDYETTYHLTDRSKILYRASFSGSPDRNSHIVLSEISKKHPKPVHISVNFNPTILNESLELSRPDKKKWYSQRITNFRGQEIGNRTVKSIEEILEAIQ